MEITTYATPKSAKAGAKRRGLELSQITVEEVQVEGETRYVYKLKENAVPVVLPTVEAEALEQYEQELDEVQNPDAPEHQVDAPVVAPVATPAPSTPAPKIKREERNGVKRPKAGGLCAAVWEYMDAHGNCTFKDIKPTAEASGWNLNNVKAEMSAWRKFNGLTAAK